MAVTFVNYYNSIFIFFMVGYPSDFIVVVGFSKFLNSVYEGFNFF